MKTPVHYNNTDDNSTNMTTATDCMVQMDKIHNLIYLIGTCASFIACFVACIIYIIIRDQIFKIGPDKKDETKHWINLNFVISFILRDILVIVLLVQSFTNEEPKRQNWPYIVTIFATYIIIVNFYWMFGEGLWLYLGVFCAVKRTNFTYVKMKIFILGWLLPLILVLLWSAWAISVHTFGVSQQLHAPMYVFIIGPIYLLLLANLIMMIRVLHRLSGMLQYNRKRRLAKATLAVTFLHGIQFFIPIIILSIMSRMSRGYGCVVAVVSFINGLLSALQGLFVAVFYVFTNNDVERFSRRYVNVTSRTSSQMTSRDLNQVEPTPPQSISRTDPKDLQRSHSDPKQVGIELTHSISNSQH